MIGIELQWKTKGVILRGKSWCTKQCFQCAEGWMFFFTVFTAKLNAGQILLNWVFLFFHLIYLGFPKKHHLYSWFQAGYLEAKSEVPKKKKKKNRVKFRHLHQDQNSQTKLLNHFRVFSLRLTHLFTYVWPPDRSL